MHIILKKFTCLLLVSIMLNMSLVPAFAEGLPASNPALQNSFGGLPLASLAEDEVAVDPGEGIPEVTIDTSNYEFTCSSPDSDPQRNILLPQEVAELKRKTDVENPGFKADEIDSGRGKNTEREVLENDLIVQKSDDGSATVNQLPNTAQDVGELTAYFNQWHIGPFAIGVSLDDTIRIGQCRNIEGLMDDGRGCPLTDKQLSYRNSGAGVVENFKTVWDDIKDFVSEDVFGKDKEMGQFNADELSNLQLNVMAETDTEALEAKFINRNVDQIPNSVITEDFIANVATTGDDAGSLISIYSMFDKYFNSWFSTEMVVSNFGPTLIGQAKRYAGWTARRGWGWNLNESSFVDSFRRKFMAPESSFGQARLHRMMTRTDKYGFGDAWTKGIEQTDWDSGYAFVKGGSWRKSVNEWTKQGGYLDEMTDPVTRGEFFKQIRDLRGYAHSNKAVWTQANDSYQNAIKAFGRNSPEARSELIKFAKVNGGLLDAADQPYLRLDAIELWLHEDYPGLYNAAVKAKGVPDMYIPLSKDSKPIGQVVGGFVDGKWGAVDYPWETTQEGFMQFYKISDNSTYLETVPVDDLRKNFSMYVDKAAQTAKGDFVKIDGSSVDYIARETAAGNVKIFKPDWAPLDPETPEMFAERLISTRSNRISKSMPQNLDRLYDNLVERGFAGQSRRYYSILDKAFAHEQDLLKSYFSIKGGAKWTLMPFLYWEGKRGFGFEGLSAFMLPDSWKEIEMSSDDEEIFDDAFIDVFAQHGSDEGEIFIQVLNKLPWKMVLNTISEKFNPVNEAYEKYTEPSSGWRRDVENVAYFTYTKTDCATCGSTFVPIVASEAALNELQETGRGQAVISFNAEQDMSSFFLEDIIDDDVKDEGTTLIAFGHHTNIKGESIGGQEVADDIDLIQAKKDELRCSDKVKELGFGFLGDDPHRIAGVLAFGESLGYFIFLWSGIIGSVIQQTMIVPELQDCVDDVEGYFVHMYAAYDQSKKSVETVNQKSSENAGDIVSSISNIISGNKPAPVEKDDDYPSPRDETGKTFTSPERQQGENTDRQTFPRYGLEAEESIWEKAKRELTEQANKISEKAQSKEILQMNVETMGETNGVVYSEKIYYYWFKGDREQGIYDDKSKAFFTDNAHDATLILDKENGDILFQEEGKPAEKVITSDDHTRLTTIKGNVPALAVPQRIGRVTLPEGPGIPLFEMDYKGGFVVLDPAVLECIRRNVEEQTGVPLISNDITEAFGRAEGIMTDSYPSIIGSATGKTITANGSPREIVYGDNARVLVKSDMETTMLNDREIPVGKFQSVKFKNGVILFKPAMDGAPPELLIWLRYHERSLLRPSDVTGLLAKVADDVVNPETGCPEPAIDLEAIPNLEAGDRSAITERVENFNKSIEKMGPFQMFDTDKHRFVFYSEKTSPSCNVADEGCCQDRVSIIDKQTGEVYDQPLVGGLKQTPTGVEFETADGKKHTLDFSADNGVPRISYNDMAPETLTMARGPNGAFWYDPEDEVWHPYNAQLVPLLEDFKTKGFETIHRDECYSSTQPGANTMNVAFGGAAETPFNLPSLPMQPAAMLFFMLSLLAVICASRVAIERKLKK